MKIDEVINQMRSTSTPGWVAVHRDHLIAAALEVKGIQRHALEDMAAGWVLGIFTAAIVFGVFAQ